MRRIVCVDSNRLVGPPVAFKAVAVVALIAATAGTLIEQGPISLVFAALAILLAWRLLGLSVSLEDGELIVRDILRTRRFPVNEIDVRARIVDPRREMYSAGDPAGYPEIPTASDDNTVQTAKWYELVHGKDRYSIDALMARSPANHEHVAWRLRRGILAALGTPPDSDSEPGF